MNDVEIEISTGLCYACHYDLLDEDKSNCQCKREPVKVKPEIELSKDLTEALFQIDCFFWSKNERNN